MKKQYEERLGELEGRLSELDSAEAEREQLKAVAADINAAVERRLKQIQDQVSRETADKCLQLEKVGIRVT